MFKLINFILILSLVLSYSCSSQRRSSGKNLMYSGTAVVLDDTVDNSRAEEIFEAIKNDLSSDMESGVYKYGAKGVPAKTFTIDQLRVLIGSCGAESTKCDVEIFIDKGSDTMRPLFVTDIKPISTCPDKYKAYIKGAVLLSKEVVQESLGYGAVAIGTTSSSVTTLCNANAVHDILCRKQNDIASFKKLSSYSTSYGDLTFDASTSSSSITVTGITFVDNLSNNMVCISDLIKPSLWGKTRNMVSKDQTALFKVSLEMYK